MADFQGSLLEFVGADHADAATGIGPQPFGDGPDRTPLDHGAWIDVFRGWMRGADALFEHLADVVPWQAERRQMYERVVDVPRLLCFYGEGDELPHPALVERVPRWTRTTARAGRAVRDRGPVPLPRRSRQRRVAWRPIGRGGSEDTMVAIVSVGTPRALLLRPRFGSGETRAVRARPRRPDRDGRQLPAHVGSRDPEDGPGGRAAHQHPVPARRRALRGSPAV